jgi:hypothetical protein
MNGAGFITLMLADSPCTPPTRADAPPEFTLAQRHEIEIEIKALEALPHLAPVLGQDILPGHTSQAQVPRPKYCRIEPYLDKAAPAAPLARRQRWGSALERPAPAHAGRERQGTQTKMAHTPHRPVQRTAVFLAPDCPARGHRVN